uniref:Mif2/CENP-C cupin domain-containing protein n=1 Tax=Gasterosteus aculeatus aculeatus TaxID=481459 RepID=A0AAQ4PUJ6_GASAC
MFRHFVCFGGKMFFLLKYATFSVADLDVPFKAHMPVKTSSPIEEKMVVEELDNEKDHVVSPILFACDDEAAAKTEPLLLQGPQCNGSRKTPVKVPTPSAEPEDDFLILEDEKPLWFSIPTKTATRKKQREGRTSSSDKDSSTDKSKKDSSLETAQKRQESEQAKNTLGSQSVRQRTNKSKGGEKKNKKIAEPGSDKEGLPGLEDLPEGDLRFEEQPKEKQGKKRETKPSDSRPTSKKSKQHNQQPVKTKKDRVLEKINQIQPSTRKPNKSKGRETKQSKIKNTREASRPDKVFQKIEKEPQAQDGPSSPLDLSQRDPSCNLGKANAYGSYLKNIPLLIFQRAYHNSWNEKPCTTPASVSAGGRREQFRAAESERRSRKPPGNWWQVGDVCEEAEGVSPRPQGPEPAKERKRVSKRRSRAPRLGTPKNGNTAASRKQRGGAAAPLLATPKAAVFLADAVCTVFSDGDLLGSAAVELQSSHDQSANREAPHGKVHAVPPDISLLLDANVPARSCSLCNWVFFCRLQSVRSGPSSMIELIEYEEDEDNLSMSPAALSLSDLCAPPLKPLILQPKDKDNLTEWFRSLWSVPVDKGGEVSPDQFEWYFHQGRAIGFVLDLNCGSFCNGKILLGSYMKKPLWVDHSVFNLLTSSVSVTIDGKESCFHPGQSLMVPCGRAYSIQNVTAQPAVMYFTRMLAESAH